ncbi:hypothetical protein JHK87_027356 [Glycine soja]|nr:hypothetical protein JHK87_027356 [Glycine soja]
MIYRAMTMKRTSNNPTRKRRQCRKLCEEIWVVLDDGGHSPASNRDATVASRPKTKPKDGEGSGEDEDPEQAKLQVGLNSAIVREKPNVKLNDITRLSPLDQKNISSVRACNLDQVVSIFTLGFRVWFYTSFYLCMNCLGHARIDCKEWVLREVGMILLNGSLLVPDAKGTTCNQQLEGVSGTDHTHILQVPFILESGTLLKWISRLDVWPYLETYVEDVANEIAAELQGYPDFIIGNYNDGNLVTSLLAYKIGVAQKKNPCTNDLDLWLEKYAELAQHPHSWGLSKLLKVFMTVGGKLLNGRLVCYDYGP